MEVSVIVKLRSSMSKHIGSTITLTLVALALEGYCVPMHGENQPARAATQPKFEEVVRQAEAARSANKFEQAASLYRMAVRARPNWTEGWGYLASSLYQLNRFAEARDAYRQTTVLTPKNAASWAFLGLCEYELSEYRQAFDHLFKAEQLRLGPDRDLTAQVKYHLAILWDTAGQFEEGLREMSWFPEQNLGSPEIIEALGLSVLRRPWFPYEIPTEKHEMVVLAGAAGFAESSRQLDKAKVLYEQLVTENPKERDIHYAYGRFLAKLNPDAALNEYEKEIEITPAHVPARIEAAFLCLKTGDLAKALTYAQEAAKLEPKNAAAHNLVGRSLSDMNRPADAIPELVTATRLAPRNSTFHLHLARAYQKMGEKSLAGKEMTTFNDLEKEHAAAQQGTSGLPH